MRKNKFSFAISPGAADDANELPCGTIIKLRGWAIVSFQSSKPLLKKFIPLLHHLPDIKRKAVSENMQLMASLIKFTTCLGMTILKY